MKQIKTKPVKNEEKQEKVVNSLKAEIEALKAQLTGGGGGAGGGARDTTGARRPQCNTTAAHAQPLPLSFARLVAQGAGAARRRARGRAHAGSDVGDESRGERGVTH